MNETGDLSNFRKSYEKGLISDDFKSFSPFFIFEKWFEEAKEDKMILEPNAMTLSTINTGGYPKSRVVLLKKFNSNGFTFFTNYDSNKGKSISKNNNVCLNFYWPSLEKQIIIKGNAKKISVKESNDYFNSRPYGSQIGAIVSNQSEIIKDRKFLESKFEKLNKYYSKIKPQRPQNWGGYIVKPVLFEFWQGRKNRLHDRLQFILDGNVWNSNRLSP
jgi:pyridoxamine 5'-phosphate oxidase